MPQPISILELTGARALEGELPPAKIDLKLDPGDFALVDCPGRRRASWFGDLCSGLVPLSGGQIRFLGHDWEKLPDDYAAALRGRIGRVFHFGAWIGSLDVATNILLPQLHHTREPREALLEQATEIACALGLPGLPLGHIDDVSAFDLARCACVRAFLGKPSLVVLESPVRGVFAELRPLVLNAIATARGDGAAIIWLTEDNATWRDRSLPTTHRLRLHDRGFWATGRAA